MKVTVWLKNGDQVTFEQVSMSVLNCGALLISKEHPNQCSMYAVLMIAPGEWMTAKEEPAAP